MFEKYKGIQWAIQNGECWMNLDVGQEIAGEKSFELRAMNKKDDDFLKKN